jgi:hypothetical protein
MSGANPADNHGSCTFLLLHLCLNVSFSFCLRFGKQLSRFGTKEKIKKDIILMQFRSFESGPDLSLPPCILTLSNILSLKNDVYVPSKSNKEKK